MDRQVLRKWLRAGFLEKHAWFATTEGTPQGGCISPALANWTLDGLQRLLEDHFAKTPKQQGRNKVHLVRYEAVNILRFCALVDDFSSEPSLGAVFLSLVSPTLHSRSFGPLTRPNRPVFGRSRSIQARRLSSTGRSHHLHPKVHHVLDQHPPQPHAPRL